MFVLSTPDGGMKMMSKATQHEPWFDNMRLYNRKKSEIEELIQEAESEMKVQHIRYVERKEIGSQKDMIRALLKYTRAKAVYDTMLWGAVQRGSTHPMESNVINQSAPNNR